ncbi:hypothetical protein CMK22_14605 [Candidatus Poribacteria bacterium]|nr:hypothetical protein [Candidatus Poribacteria bacterium]
MSIIKIQLLEQSTLLGFSTTFLLLADLSSPAVLATFTSSHNHHPFLNFRHVIVFARWNEYPQTSFHGTIEHFHPFGL